MSCDCFTVKIILIFLLGVFSVECQELTRRIVGGYNVTSMQNFKHQVSIRQISRDRTYGNGHLCGGSLISYNTVLTAAHCFHDGTRYISGPNFVCAMGSLDRWVRDNNTLYITVLKTIGHKSFKPKTFANDIGLMILSREVPVNHPTVQPIALSERYAAAGQSCQISGWGTIAYEGSQPNRLKAANLNINSRSDCNEPSRHAGNVLTGMFCAGPFSGSNLVDSCQGDSGGPLTCNNTLVGITSNGVECARPNYPGIYTDVYHYKKWILSNDSARFALTNYFLVMILAVLLAF